MYKEYKKYFIVPASPEEVYLALTTETTVMLWTGSDARMSTEEGSEFSLWDESIVGKNIRFEENKLIEQEWYFGEENEPSMVVIKLHPHKKGTSVEVRQNNIPEEDFENISEGWEEEYFGSLIDFYTE